MNKFSSLHILRNSSKTVTAYFNGGSDLNIAWSIRFSCDWVWRGNGSYDQHVRNV